MSSRIHATPASATSVPPPRMTSLAGIAAACAGYLLLFGGAVFAVLWHFDGQPGLLQAALCAAPMGLAVVLSFTGRCDRRQYVTRLGACAVMLPVLQLMWASSERLHVSGLTGWLVWDGASLIHAAAVCVAVWWLARKATGIAAVAGCGPVGAAALGRRLISLGSAGLPVDLTQGPSGRSWVVSLRFAPGVDRSHHIGLVLDEATLTVTVREQLGARGAAPQGADEASLRTVGDPAFDPARPEANKVWAHAVQATIIKPQRLARLRPAFNGDQVVLQARPAEPMDGESVVTLLAAVVTGSGYAWQAELGRVAT